MGPLGILTAVVSAIRVAGGPFLKAFIGRAQESPGVVELELLSCTSDTTAELWSQGGISRVFGKPSILEVVLRARKETPTTLSSSSSSSSSSRHRSLIPGTTYAVELMDESLGEKGAWELKDTNVKARRSDLETPSELYKSRKWNDQEEGEWMEFEDGLDRRETAANPNLSLNVGIKRRQEGWFQATALLGVSLQSGEYPSAYDICLLHSSTS